MKKINLKLFIPLGLMIIIFFLIYSNMYSRSKYIENTPKTVIDNYMKAVKNNNAQEIVKYVIDNRFPNKEALINFYKRDLIKEGLKEYHIINTTILDENHATINTSLTFINGNIINVNNNLEKNSNGEWKVLISYH
jgi:hypothetical protein